MTDEEKYKVFKSMENINLQLEIYKKENAELKEYAEKLSEQHADEWQKQQEVITELKAQNKIILEDNDTLNKWVDELKAQVEKYKTEKNYYDNLCHNKTVECDDLRKGIKQFQSDNDKFIKKIEEIAEENAELKAQVEKLSNDNHVLKTSFIIQKEKIEKMKILFEIIKSRSYTANIYNIAIEGMELAE